MSRALPHRRDGFSLVEVIVSLSVLSIGLVALASTTLLVTRQITISEVTTKRASLQSTVIEHVLGQPYDAVGAGTDSIANFRATWASVAEGTQTKLVTVVTLGPGMSRASTGFPSLSGAVADTFRFRVVRP